MIKIHSRTPIYDKRGLWNSEFEQHFRDTNFAGRV